MSAALWPLSVDGVLKPPGGDDRRSRNVVRLAFLLGTVVSLAANIAAAPELTWRPVLVAGWPPLALLLSVEPLAHRPGAGTEVEPKDGAGVGARTGRDSLLDWLTALFVEAAVRATRMRSRRERSALEEEHRVLLLRDTVERRLLAEARIPPGHDAELIATDIAFTASKELVRGCGTVCGGPVADVLLPVETAALSWAGVDPDDHDTWMVHRGDCPHVADEPSPWD
ncbi:hypothetical protein [Streptomyces sp. S.PB5]|uniref:hypothetical protein n=1 Tax=Streptomyces sp. S.PB5 TaxID=3020844 RepID=UPI0025AF1AAE|nr:hypothetical protein [Streptomyces sp. S.PB5]MDN3025735.1 hypothetical protein [Streptomyces sp. S.PB5]